MTHKPKVLIIGAGFAGIFCAKKLFQLFNDSVEITIVNKTKHFEYHAQIYKVLNEGSPLQACIPLDVIFKNTNINYVEDTIQSINKEHKIAVGSSNFKYQYDYLVICLGSQNAYFNIPGISKYSYSLRSINDALSLSRHIHETIQEMAQTNSRTKMEIAIVGGGPSGVEIAGELAEHTQLVALNHSIDPKLIHITLIEAMDRLLPMLPPEQSQKIQSRLKSLNVTVKTKTTIKEEIPTGLITENDTITTNTVIWVAGVAANQRYQEWGFNTLKNGRVQVDPTLQVPSHPEIFIAGDGASVEGSGQAWPAVHQGNLVATNIYNILQHHPLQNWKPLEPLMILPIGYDWAFAQIHGQYYSGSAGSLLHELYKLKFYTHLLPISEAWSTFKSGGEMCHSCKVCLHNHQQSLH